MVEAFFDVQGGNPPSSPILWDYSTVKSVKGYPLTPSQIFNNYVDVRTNSDPNGYTVSMTIGNGVPPTNTTTGCIPIFFNIKDKNGNDLLSMVPFLDSAAHIILFAEDDAIYHSHATWLLPGMSFSNIVSMLKNTTVDVSLNDTNSFLALMDALMIGVNPNGTYNCILDEAKQMAAMKMDMNTFYGPVPFGPNLVSLFDWINIGNWRIWVYFAVNTGNGTDLVVADFAAITPGIPIIYPSPVYGSASTLDLLFSLIIAIIITLVNL